jgi:hypothetical protein
MTTVYTYAHTHTLTLNFNIFHNKSQATAAIVTAPKPIITGAEAWGLPEFAKLCGNAGKKESEFSCTEGPDAKVKT